MAGSTVICEGCGAVCNTEDGYCKSCWKKLPCESEDNDGVLEGIGHSDWKEFIEKKTDYYMPVFQKNEGKKVFISLNWAAVLFGNNWLFYRKMYKAAIAAYAVNFVLLILLTLLFTIPFFPEIQALREPISAYEDYIENGGEKVLYTPDGDTVTPEIVKEYYRADARISDIEWSVSRKSTLTAAIIQPLLLGLFGNAIYKAHIKKRIHDPGAGGASISSMIFGWILFDFIEYAFAYLAVIIIIMLGP